MAKTNKVPPIPPEAAGPPADDASTTWWIVGAAVVLLAFGGWMGWEAYPALVAGSWPTTEGTVKKVKFFEKRKLGENINSAPRSMEVELEYDYTVNGTNYTGTAYNNSSNVIDPAEAPTLQQKLKVGNKVTVHYSSWMPRNSLLAPAATTTAWGRLAISVACLLGAIGLFALAFWPSTPKAAAPA